MGPRVVKCDETIKLEETREMETGPLAFFCCGMTFPPGRPHLLGGLSLSRGEDEGHEGGNCVRVGLVVPTREELCVGVDPQLAVDPHSNGALGFRTSSSASKEMDPRETPLNWKASLDEQLGGGAYVATSLIVGRAEPRGAQNDISRASGATIKDAACIYQVEV